MVILGLWTNSYISGDTALQKFPLKKFCLFLYCYALLKGMTLDRAINTLEA